MIAKGLDIEITNADVGKHHHQVVLALLAMGVRAERADELAQAAWEKLLRKVRAGELVEIELPGLAIRQARFLALDELRGKSGTGPVSLVDAVDPQSIVIAREELERVRAILERCRPNAREVFRLFYVEGLGNASDVAERVGLSVQRVRQTLCEVRKKLRDVMEDEL